MTSTQRESFISAYRHTGNITLSAKVAGVGRKEALVERDSNDKFANAFYLAKEEAGERMEGAAWERAFEGIEQPVYQGGKMVGTRKIFSDILAIFMLKAHNPVKYRDNHPGEKKADKATQMTDKELERILREK